MKNIFFTALLSGLVVTLCSAIEAQDLRQVFRQVNASVVIVRTQQNPTQPALSLGEATDEFGLGSGFLISADGKIVTAAHVIQGADKVEVEFLGGEVIPARVIASAPYADLALLQLDRPPSQPTVAKLSDSDQAGVGEQVFVIGAPYGVSHTLSVGYLSAKRTQPNFLENFAKLEVLQTDAAVYSGNSGGPMFNLKGEVIGVISYVLAKDKNAGGLGFAVASNVARRLLLEEKSFYTGVEAYFIQGPLLNLFNVSQDGGLLVQSVADGSPAARLGLREGFFKITIADQTIIAGGDVILEMQGVKITGDPTVMGEILQRLNHLKAGELLTVKVLRAGRVLDLAVSP